MGIELFWITCKSISEKHNILSNSTQFNITIILNIIEFVTPLKEWQFTPHNLMIILFYSIMH